MVKEWSGEPVNHANFRTGTKLDSWRRALAHQHFKQDSLNERAEALRHEIQFPEQSVMSQGRTLRRMKMAGQVGAGCQTAL
jgi:hypothetical protein